MAIPFDEYVRAVGSPLTSNMLAPLGQGCRVVQFSSAMSDRDYATLAEWLADYPQVTLRAYGGYDRPITNLEFLRFFPKLRAFQADSLYRDLENIDGLGFLPEDAFEVGLGATRKRLSLAPLRRFDRLPRLYLEGLTKDIEVISTLTCLTSLTLRSITLPNLAILTPLHRLRALDLKRGGTSNLDLLPQIGELQYLELWQVRGLDDIGPIAHVGTLQHLFMQALRRVTGLPSFAACTRLRHVHLETMKGLTDLSPLLTAEALTDLAVVDMGHLKSSDVTILQAHPALRRLSVGLGSMRKNNEVKNNAAASPDLLPQQARPRNCCAASC
ncbi:MAG TPA: hypothetical protein VF062_04295 [Candidatus Limnocylindrales bacterium]